MNGSYAPAESPCGANCSYTATFFGPSFACDDVTMNVNDLATIAFQQYRNQSSSRTGSGVWVPDSANYLAVDHVKNRTNPGSIYDQVYSLDMLFKEVGDSSSKTLRGLSCVAYKAEYTAKVNYTNFVQKVELNVKKLQPLNASLTRRSSLFYNLLVEQRKNFYETPLPDEFRVDFATNDSQKSRTETVFEECNLLAIKDSLTQVLGGAISSYGKWH
jgi:hypothetical protein